MTSTQNVYETPRLQPVMSLEVEIAPGDALGRCADGLRSNYRILGGHFEGPQLRGEVLPGGADFYLQRHDGIGDLDARYSLRTDQGELINIYNRGLLLLTERGKQLEAEGCMLLPISEYRCTCTPVFQAAGRLAWLTQDTFIGRVTYPWETRVVIDCYRLV
jgi:hypothetical protein